MLNAVADVIAQDLFLDATEGSPYGGDLRHNVDAIPVLFDHAGQAADLALNPVETLKTGCLCVFLHA